MGNFSRPPLEVLLENLAEDKNYVGVHIEQGVPVLDRDLNLLGDIIAATLRSVIARYIGDGIPVGSSGFAIEEATPAVDNEFRIVGGGVASGDLGRCLVGGIEVTIDADLNYSAQTVPTGELPLNPLPLTTPSPDPRTDIVYLDVWLREVDSTEDDALNNALDIGIRTSVRLTPAWLVRVEEGAEEPPTPQPGHIHYQLARLSRAADVPQVQAAMITDLRQPVRPLIDVEQKLIQIEQRLSNLETEELVPAFVDPPGQFAPTVGTVGQEVTLSGTNFNGPGLSVRFGNVTVAASGIVSVSETTIVVRVPSGITNPPVTISVQTNFGTTTSSETFTPF